MTRFRTRSRRSTSDDDGVVIRASDRRRRERLREPEREVQTEDSPDENPPSGLRAERVNSSEHPLHGIQRRFGNRAAQRAAEAGIDAKLSVGRVDDPAEREADRVARTLLRGSGSAGVEAGRETESAPEHPSLDAAVSNPRPGPASRTKPETGPPDSATSADVDGVAGLERDVGTATNAGRGRPLSASARSFFEPRFEADLGGVRIHEGPNSARMNETLGARAFTYGSDVFFASGESVADRWLLAHELAHVMQNSRLREAGDGSQSASVEPSRGAVDVTPSPSRETVRRANGGPSIVYFTGTGYPLDRYAVLREHLTEESWEALNRAARLREQQAATQSSVTPPEAERTTEVELPLGELLRPEPAPESADWEQRLFDEGIAQLQATGGQVPPTALAPIIQQELLQRWLSTVNWGEGTPVRVALVDPAGELGGESSLTFQVDGNPVMTADGSLYVAALDRAGPNVLGDVREAMLPELERVTEQIEVAYSVPKIIEDSRAAMALGHRKLAYHDLIQRRAELERFAERADAAGARTREHAATLRTFVQREFARFIREHEQFREENEPDPSFGESMMETVESNRELAENLREEGGFWNQYAAGQISGANLYGAGGYGLANLFSGNAPEQSRQTHQAYREGKISLKSLEEASDAIFWRGMLHVGINAALMLASGGLAGAVRGASLGRQVLAWGGTSALGTMGAMGASTWLTRSRTFADPDVQAIWRQGEYSPTQILLGGGLSFGIGAAIPVVGWIAQRGNARLATVAAEASATGGQLPPMPGVDARVVRPGVVSIRVPGKPGALEVTRDGWRALAQAGSRESVVATGTWADDVSRLVEIPEGVAGGQFAMHDVPFAVGVSQRGWGAFAPGTARPLQFGPWDDLALPGAAGAPMGGQLVPTGPSALTGGGFSGLGTAGRSPVVLGPGSASPAFSVGGAGGPSGLLAGAQPVTVPLVTESAAGLLGPATGAGVPRQYSLVVRPSTAMELWGDPGWERVPGNAPVRSQWNGERRLLWQWVEQQGTNYLDVPTQTQVSVRLPRPMQFAGRSEPQNTIVLDNRSATGSLYADVKARNWGYTSNVEDLIGTLQRMVVAQQVESMAPMSLPHAATGEIVVVTTRTVPREVNNHVVSRLMEWLMRDQGMDYNQAHDVLRRITFAHMRPEKP